MIIVADGILLSITMPLGSDLCYEAMLADDRWCSFMIQVSNLRHLITTYRRGHIVTDEFRQVASEHIKADWVATMYSNDVSWLANSIPNVIASVLLFVAGQAFFEGRLELGFFVTLIDTCNSFGAILGAIFALVFDICKGLASVQKIAAMLNCEVIARRCPCQSDSYARAPYFYRTTEPPNHRTVRTDAPWAAASRATATKQVDRDLR